MKYLLISFIFNFYYFSLWANDTQKTTAKEEWRVKRESNFEFSQKPLISKQGDDISIKFETKAFCDVTIAIESNGKIIRHLASGVLGGNAPKPFTKKSKKQNIIWDSKDDKGKYVTDINECTIRVSLGLKPTYEKSLCWNPKKRIGAGRGISKSTHHNSPTPIMVSRPEGVYIFEGAGVDHLRLFDHKGNYLKTIYPFPANKINQIKGLTLFTSPQDSKRLPLKHGFLSSTFLTSGSNGQGGSSFAGAMPYARAMHGSAAMAMTVRGKHIALAFDKISRLGTDGSSAGLNLKGPPITLNAFLGGRNRSEKYQNIKFPPLSIALSPNGKWLYLTGYLWRDGVSGRNLSRGCMHGVWRMEYKGNKKPTLFLGTSDQNKPGSGQGQFNEATCVSVDNKGRVYIGDYINDRVQIFSESGKFIKAIKAVKPVKIFLHPKSQEIYVASWMLDHEKSMVNKKVPATLINYGTLETPTKKEICQLPFRNYTGKYLKYSQFGGFQNTITVDFYGEKIRIWVITKAKKLDAEDRVGDGNATTGAWPMSNVEIYSINNGSLKQIESFNDDVIKTIARHRPPYFWRQRLHVNPTTGNLFVFESNMTRWYKAAYEVLKVSPDTEKHENIQMPFDAEDMAFDINGNAYLKIHFMLVRYDISSTPWKEIPFDYGEENETVSFTRSKTIGRITNIISGISIKPPYVSQWHNGGIWIQPNGNILVSMLIDKCDPKQLVDIRIKKLNPLLLDGYVPDIYPGRIRQNEVHLYNQHGQIIKKDVAPGSTSLHGVLLGKDNAVYIMSTQARVGVNGKPFNQKSMTMTKLSKGKAKIICDSKRAAVPLSNDNKPRRPHDAFSSSSGKTWFENADWMYGGVGFEGKGDGESGGGCSCWNARPTLDYYDRVFAPEVDHFSVAVLDSAGNLILRVGKYGNADSQGPKSLVPLGGDEVGLMHAQYLGVHSDKRLFIADAGNARIVSVKLNYHNSKIIVLKDLD